MKYFMLKKSNFILLYKTHCSKQKCYDERSIRFWSLNIFRSSKNTIFFVTISKTVFNYGGFEQFHSDARRHRLGERINKMRFRHTYTRRENHIPALGLHNKVRIVYARFEDIGM